MSRRTRRTHSPLFKAKVALVHYLRYFNEEHPHQGLDNRTPDHVFYERKPLADAA